MTIAMSLPHAPSTEQCLKQLCYNAMAAHETSVIRQPAIATDRRHMGYESTTTVSYGSFLLRSRAVFRLEMGVIWYRHFVTASFLSAVPLRRFERPLLH